MEKAVAPPIGRKGHEHGEAATRPRRYRRSPQTDSCEDSAMACRFGKSVWFDHLSGYVQNTRRGDGEPQNIPQVGRFAVLIDPVGVALCAIRGDR